MAKLLVTTLEKRQGVIITGDFDLSQKMTEDEFAELIRNEKVEYVGVDHEFRVNFLKNNGYEVNRENMVDLSLTVNPTDSEKINSAEKQTDIG